MDEKHGMLICIYVLQFLTALKLLSELVRIGLKARSDWSRFWKRWRELLGHVQEWQRSDARVNHFFELTLCRLLHSSSQVMLVALFLRLLVVEWHLLYSRTRHDLQPELDLSNALAYGLLLLLCSWPRLVSPESLDAWYVVLQILCTVPLLSTQTADVTMVSLITLLPRFLLGLCCRRVWLAALGAIIYWLLSLRSVLSPEGASNDLPLVQSFELLVFFAGMVALRHQMYENVRVSLSLQKRSIELGAASALLYSFCDAVVELDDELKITNTANQLSTMLLRSVGGPPPALVGSDYLGLFVEEDRDSLKTSLRSEITSRVSARMVDALGSTVNMELLYTSFENTDHQKCRLVGMRELQEAADVAPLKATKLPESDMSLMFDACSFEILGTTDSFKRVMMESGTGELDQLSIYDLVGPIDSENSIAFVSGIQSAVNSLDPQQVQTIQLGTMEILNQTVQAVLKLQNDELLKTVVGTLVISLGTPSLRSKSRSSHSRLASRTPRNDEDGRSGSILELRNDQTHSSL